ncbi:MAG TPA: CbiX/SirB N-terminal domain-containing protein [bacterium]|nr:CbiX/SirB N-terminal domain-containing protein [bacterium]
MRSPAHDKAYVIIAHGSREAKGNRTFLRVVAKLRSSTRKRLFGAFLDLAAPSIPEALEQAVDSGAQEVVVVPLMLFPGRHSVQDVPRIVRKTARRHRNIRFLVKKALAHHPKLLPFLKEILR